MTSALPGFAVSRICLAPGIGTGVEDRSGTVVQLPGVPGCPTAVAARLERSVALTGNDDCRTLRAGWHGQATVATTARDRAPGELTGRLNPGSGWMPGPSELPGSGRSVNGTGRPNSRMCTEPFRRTA